MRLTYDESNELDIARLQESVDLNLATLRLVEFEGESPVWITELDKVRLSGNFYNFIKFNVYVVTSQGERH